MRVQPTLPPRYLRTPDAANFVGLSIRTLEKHRSCGTGPLYRQLGGRIVYAVEDLCAWADLNVRLSTGDGGGIPMPSDPRAYHHPLAGQGSQSPASGVPDNDAGRR
ncbi:helix-turn-helix transcriptional regulator [Komagataeibacter rhaeticus]